MPKPGPALLFIHGFPLGEGIWKSQVARFQPERSTLAVDLGGFGANGDVYVETLEEHAQILVEVMDEIGATKFVPVGHSMGGYILFALHRLVPDRFAGAILVGTKSKPDSDEAKRTREATAAKVEIEGVSAVMNGMLPKLFAPTSPDALRQTTRKIIEANPPEGVAAALRAMATRPDSTPQLSQMKFPVLILHGTQDQLIPFAEAEEMAKLLPAATLVRCEKSGHMSMMEESGLVSNSIAAFLKTL